MRRRGLSSRIFAACGGVIFVVGVASAFLLSAMATQRHSTSMARQAQRVLLASTDAERHVIDLETGERGYLVAGKARFLEPWEVARAELPAKLGQLQAMVRSVPEQHRRAAAIAASVAAYRTEWSEPLVDVALSGGLAEARRMTASGEGKRRIDALRAQFKAFDTRETRLVQLNRSRAAAHAHEAELVGIAALLATLLGICAFAAALVRTVVAPIRRAASTARRLERGDLSARVDAGGQGEVRDLAHAFNAMAASLRDSRDELETQNSELEAQQVEIEDALDQLGREKAQVDEFRRFIELVAAEKDPERLAATVLTELCAYMGASVGTLYGVDPGDGSTLVAMTAIGLELERLPREILPGEGLAGRAIVERQILSATFPEKGVELDSFGKTLTLNQELHVPLVHGEQAVGVATLGRMAALPLGEPDLERLRYLAAQAAVGLSHAFALRRAHHQAALNRAVLETAHDAFVAFDTRGCVTAWNPQAEATFGWSAREANGKVLSDLIAPERDRATYGRAIARFLIGQESELINRRLELTALHRDGREFPIELTIAPIRLGDRWQFNAFLHDISARRLLEEQSSRLFSMSLDLMCTFTTDCRLRQINPAWSQVLGWSEEELLGASMIEYVHPDDREKTLERARQLELDGEGSADFENRWRCADGSYRWLLWSAHFSRYEQLIYGVAKDVTETKRAERAFHARYAVTKALADSDTLEQDLTGVLAAAGEGLGWELGAGWLLGEDRRTMRCAGTWVADGVDDGGFQELARSLTFEPGQGLVGEAWEAGEPGWLGDMREVIGEPGYAHAEAAGTAGVRASVAVPLVGEHGVVSVIQLLAREPREPDDDALRVLEAIGEQVGQALEKRLARMEADRMKDEFLALVSHELRTPLTSIVGYLELLSDDELEGISEHGRHFLEVIERNAVRLQRLVDDVLFAARAEAGRLALDHGRVDLAAVASESVATARPRAQDRGVALQLDAERMPALRGDSDRLGQALDNLISNALKFTPPGGRIDLVLRDLGETAVIEVRDTGLGMSDEDRQRVFDRFFRAPATRDHAPGVGLGLTIVKTIVEGHGGSVEVASTEGVGSTFRIELPVARAAASVSRPASRS